MKYRTLVLVAVVMLFAALVSPAYAQYETSDKSRIGLGLSSFFPVGGELQSLTSYWLSPRMDLHLTFDKQDRPQTMLSISWLSENNSSADARMVPIEASYIKHFSNDRDKSPYAGAGLVGAVVLYNGYVPFLGQEEASATEFGTTWFAGYEYNSWFAELRYDMISPLPFPGGGSVNFSGMCFTLGTHYAF